MNRTLLVGFKHFRAFVVGGVVGSVVVGGVAGCPITGAREGIGASCTTGKTVCPLDHVCVPDDVEQGAGVCAPVLDYGSCDAPTWPVRESELLDDDLEVDTVGDLDFLTDVSRVEGDLIIAPPSAAAVLQLGSLCGVSGLQQVLGSVVVKNTDLTTLDGLQGLSVVGAGIGVAGNRLLVDVAGLTNLLTVAARENDSFSVLIADNAALPEAALIALRQALQATEVSSARLYACGNVRGGNGNDDNECPASINALLRR